MTDKNIKRLEESIDTIDNLKIAIEPGVDAFTGVKLMGYKDADGNARRLLVKGENVPTKSVFPETDDTYNVGGSANTYKDAFFKDENGVVFTARQLAKTIRGIFVSEDVPAEDDPKTWFLKLIHYFNGFTWNRDIGQSDWIVIEPSDTKDGTDGIIAGAVSANHGVRQLEGNFVLGEHYTLECEAEAVDVSSIQLRFAMNTSRVVGFNLSTLAMDNNAGTVEDYKLVDIGGGRYRVLVEVVSDLTGASIMYLYSATDETAPGRTFAGDGVSVSTRITKMSVRPGTIKDNFPVLDTTTVPVSAPAYVYQEKILPTVSTKKLQNVETGLMETVPKLRSGSFKITTVTDAGGGEVLMTTLKPHFLITGQEIEHLTNFAYPAYEGDVIVTVVDERSYKITAVFSGTSTGTAIVISNAVSVTDAGGGEVLITTNGNHGLTTGQSAYHFSDFASVNYEGIFIVTVVTDTTYKITATWGATDTGTIMAWASAKYFTPDQRSDMYGKLVRQYFRGSNVDVGVELELIPAPCGITGMPEVGGYIEDVGTDNLITVNNSAGGFAGAVYRKGDALTLYRGSQFNIYTDMWDVYVDTMPSVEPVNTPIGFYVETGE